MAMEDRIGRRSFLRRGALVARKIREYEPDFIFTHRTGASRAEVHGDV